MKIILKSLNTNIKLSKGIFYSMVEFYFSGVTPSSTGGQPVQLYFMTKDGIPINNSYITLILNTIYFKIIIVFLGIMVLIFKNNYILNSSFFYILFFVLGIIFDLVIVIICLLLLFNQKLIKKIYTFLIKIGRKMPIIKNKIKNINIEETLEKYQKQVEYIKSHKSYVIITFLITLLQRLLMFSITYFVYRGMNLNGLSYFELLAIQISVQVTMEMFPLPGGAGLSENMFKDVLSVIFGLSIASAGMIFIRLFSFYIPLVLCGLIICISYIKNSINKKKIVR